MERLVAIDNVCAWPNLTQLADGELIASIFNQPCHGRWVGDVECWASRDGRFWSYRGTPAPHDPATNRMNVAAGCAADDSLIVLAAGWSNRSPVPRPMPMLPHDPLPDDLISFDVAQVLEPWVCRSHDAGRTWTQQASVERPETMAVLIPFGDVCLDAQRRPCASFYGWDTQSTRREGRWLSWFFRSDDGGETWKPVSVIGDGNHNETTLLHLGDGRWLAAARTVRGLALELFVSADDGQSWEPRGPVTLAGQIPGHLMRLSDGRVLLHFGIRNAGLHGVGVRLSDDEGETWGPPRIMVQYDVDADGGYPAGAQLDDGTLVTAYYSACTDAHQRYHMGTLRWHPERVETHGRAGPPDGPGDVRL